MAVSDPLAETVVPPPTVIISTTPPADPPPPYPSRERRARISRPGRRRRASALDTEGQHHRQQISSAGTDSDPEGSPSLFPEVADRDVYDAATETTPLLPQSPGLSSPRLIHGGIGVRPRTLSITSTLRSSTSIAPSFAQTVLSALHPDRDSDLDPDCDGEHSDGEPRIIFSPQQLSVEDPQQALLESSRLGRRRLGAENRWATYFRPLWKRAYYSAAFHLLVLNFPYALLAWVYLFVFTLTGTTTLMALPLGAVLCFIDLIGARSFSRGELSLQATFHGPLAFPPPYPPLPIFTRPRPPTDTDVEVGIAHTIYERSFYRNAYSMFTDPTSYQALFYFLVIKPGITLILSISLIILVPVSFALILPAPAMLRLVRRLGIWQANIAIEALYYAVR